MVHYAGVQSFTMDDIASRPGHVEENLYRYFVSRQELVEKVANRLASDYEAAMVTVDEKSVDSLKKLLGYIGTVLNYCKKRSIPFSFPICAGTIPSNGWN